MIGHVVLQSQAMLKARASCLELLLLLPALSHVDLEGLVPLDDRVPLEAQEHRSRPNEQSHEQASDCNAGNSAASHAIVFDGGALLRDGGIRLNSDAERGGGGGSSAEGGGQRGLHRGGGGGSGHRDSGCDEHATGLDSDGDERGVDAGGGCELAAEGGGVGVVAHAAARGHREHQGTRKLDGCRGRRADGCRGWGRRVLAHGVRDGVIARVLARGEAAVLVVGLEDGCARGLQRVELLGNGEFLANPSEEGGGVAVGKEVPVRRPLRVLLCDHCRVRPRSREVSAREVKSHARIVQPEVNRVGNLDAASSPPAGRRQAGCRYPLLIAGLPGSLAHILPVATEGCVGVHNGHAQLLEHHQNRVLVGRREPAANVTVWRGSAVWQVSRHCAHTPRLRLQCHRLEGLNFGAEGGLVVGRGRCDVAHSQRARQFFKTLDNLDEPLHRRIFGAVLHGQLDDRDAPFLGSGLQLRVPRPDERRFDDKVRPAVHVEKGVVETGAPVVCL
eukprot:scaffold32037_cov66-Phaeocystis_antarctica.AAC.2